MADWIAPLVKVFRRQLGVEAVEENLWGWICLHLAGRDSDLQVLEGADSP